MKNKQNKQNKPAILNEPIPNPARYSDKELAGALTGNREAADAWREYENQLLILFGNELSFPNLSLRDDLLRELKVCQLMNDRFFEVKCGLTKEDEKRRER